MEAKGPDIRKALYVGGAVAATPPDRNPGDEQQEAEKHRDDVSEPGERAWSGGRARQLGPDDPGAMPGDRIDDPPARVDQGADAVGGRADDRNGFFRSTPNGISAL